MKTRACNAPLHIVLRPSKTLSACLAGVHALAACSLWLGALPTCLRLILSGVLLIHVLVVLGRHWCRPAFMGMGCDPAGAWWLERPHGPPMVVRILPDTLVLPFLVLVSCRCQRGSVHRLALPADSMSGEDMRRMRQRLRLGVGRAIG